MSLSILIKSDDFYKKMSKKGAGRKRLEERPPWNDGTEEQQQPLRRAPLNPVWAQEVVSLPPKNPEVRFNPDELPPYQDPMGERLPKPRRGPRKTVSGKTIPEDDPNMVWQCPYCGEEWYADEPGRCPKCHTDLYAPRPTFGLMHPLIAAMQMIDEGYDPRTGEIDEVMDRLMKEQIESVGGHRPDPPQRKVENKRRLLFIPEGEQQKKKEPGATYLQLVDVPAGSKKTCAICHMQLKQSQRVVKLNCGHMMHSNCISQHFKHSDSCPVCNNPLN